MINDPSDEHFSQQSTQYQQQLEFLRKQETEVRDNFQHVAQQESAQELIEWLADSISLEDMLEYLAQNEARGSIYMTCLPKP